MLYHCLGSGTAPFAMFHYVGCIDDCLIFGLCMYIVFLKIQMFSLCLCLLVRQKKITCVKNLFLTVEVNSSKNANAVKQIV